MSEIKEEDRSLCLHKMKRVYQVSQSWYKRKAGNPNEYCLSSVVDFVMHWLNSALFIVSHFY